MFPVIHQYKLRLTNLSQANRSLKLSKLSRRKDIDLSDLAFLNGLSGVDILSKVVAGSNISLIKNLSARDESNNLADRRLNKIWHEVNTIYEETGTYDLFVGYPFVEGRFLDGSIARCPLVLFPVKLIRNFQGSPRWALQVNKEEELNFNKTFFLAYEKFMQSRLSKEFWEEDPSREGDLQGFLNALYKQLNSHEVEAHFNSELFQFRLDRFMDKNKAILESQPIGQLRLVPNAVLGIFPQSDSALLQDYETLEEAPDTFKLENFLQAQPLVSNPAYVKENERFYVSRVDQSQEEGLLKVRKGESLVLHGPPGTGKSQVILNLISDALARGERVLVCSQKRAALDVVYQRMAEVGLGRFAALVHDYRGDRSKIFGRIRQQIEDIESFQTEGRDIGIDIWLRDFRRDSRKLDEHNHFFERLHALLSQRGRFGLSAHEMYIRGDREAESIDMNAVAGAFDYAAAKEFQEKLRGVLSYAEFFSNQNPWRWRQPLHLLGVAGKDKLLSRLEALYPAIEDLEGLWNQLQGPGRHIGERKDFTKATSDFNELVGLLDQKDAINDLLAAEKDGLTIADIQSKLDALAKLFEQMNAFKVIDDLPLSMNDDLQSKYKTYKKSRGKGSRFFSKSWLQSWWYVRQLLGRRDMDLDDKELKILEKELRTNARLIKLALKLNELAFFADMPLVDTVKELMAWHEKKSQNLVAIEAWRSFDEWPSLKPKIKDGAFDVAFYQMLKKEAQDIEKIDQHLTQQSKSWATWLHPRQIKLLQMGLQSPEVAKGFLGDLMNKLETDFDDLASLDAQLAKFSANESKALAHVQTSLSSLEGKAVKAFPDVVMNGFFLSWVVLFEAENPELLEVSSRAMPERLESYRRLLEERSATVTGLIQRKLKDAITDNIEYNRLNNPVTYREIAHQVRKKRQLWSVRKLIQNFWEEGLSQLMPCWMASPESVAAIFPMVKDHFDLVIFDEASQCYVERALPVMLRGRQAVIAGDDKQLPPYDLYNVKVEEEEDGFFEDEMALEVESILDLARNIFSECKLNWHYRSSEEELINFSNHAFYEGRLNIIPAAKHEAISRPPIEFIKVDGVWEKNRNVEEAKRVVALVETLVMRPENPTIGVVTFNYHQKELIWTMLEERLLALTLSGESEVLAKLHAAMEREEGEERQGIFVKNIENVQGDERDVIIFSIGYAHDPKGKMVAHFGLLNQKGGGNRLNVAISRAKKKGIVVCSIEPEELKVDNAKHEGPRLLRSYLQYARAISKGDLEIANNILKTIGTSKPEPLPEMQMAGNVLADRLETLLKAKGLRVMKQVGDTKFKLDLAIVDKEGHYLLGIECEGRNYFSGKSAKEREVYRPMALRSRGWEVYRVWARNFFLNPEGEVENILEALDLAKVR